MYYTNSQAKTTLESWYQTNIGSKKDLAKNVASGAYYCEQAKAKYSDSYTSGSATMTTYKSYTPDFKCIADGNGKGVVNASVGLLNYDEVVYAGGYPLQENNSYFLYNLNYSWLMSPSGYSNSNNAPIWGLDKKGYLVCYVSTSLFTFRPVINLTADTQISDGDGSINSPFVVE